MNLDHFGMDTITLAGPQELTATTVVLPADLSSAAFFIVAALLVDGSTLRIPNVGVNPTRRLLLVRSRSGVSHASSIA